MSRAYLNNAGAATREIAEEIEDDAFNGDRWDEDTDLGEYDRNAYLCGDCFDEDEDCPRCEGQGARLAPFVRSLGQCA